MLTVAGVASLAVRHSAQKPPPSPTRYMPQESVDVVTPSTLEEERLLATATQLTFEGDNSAFPGQ